MFAHNHMRLFITFIIILISGCSSQPQTPISNYINEAQYNAAEYETLVSSIQTEPTLSKISELRQVIALRDKDKLNAFAEEDLNQQILIAIEAVDWPLCLQKVDQALTHNYANLTSHYGAMVCYLETGHDVESQYHQTVMNQLLEGVWQTGDGESLDTAFEMLNDPDQAAFIEFHGLEVIKFNVASRDGQQFDIVTLYDAQKDEVFEWYFTRLKP